MDYLKCLGMIGFKIWEMFDEIVGRVNYIILLQHQILGSKLMRVVV